jgi:hypothetical protein
MQINEHIWIYITPSEDELYILIIQALMIRIAPITVLNLISSPNTIAAKIVAHIASVLYNTM